MDTDNFLRQFETDETIPDGYWIMVRLDGRNFSGLTFDMNYEKPFDIKFRDAMIGTVSQLMNCGFNVIYGYTQSDEITMVLQPNDQTFNRRRLKIATILSGEASSYMSMAIAHRAVFDCRVAVMPNVDIVVQYLRWRYEDAVRNGLNAWSYWTLRHSGLSDTVATNVLLGQDRASKNEILYKHGVNYNNTPTWQRRGIGLYFTDVQHTGFNPMTEQEVQVIRRRIEVNTELPMGDQYDLLVRNVISSNVA